MNKKFLIAASFISVAFLISMAAASSVRAESESEGSQGIGQQVSSQTHGAVVSQVARGESESESGNSGNMSESVSMQSDGSFKVTGVKVNSVDAASNTINVTFYGFQRTVSVSGANIQGAGQTIDISKMQAGDVLSAQGKFDETTHVITVSQVNDLSYTASGSTSDVQSQINNLLQLVQQLQAQLRSMQGGGQTQGGQ